MTTQRLATIIRVYIDGIDGNTNIVKSNAANHHFISYAQKDNNDGLVDSCMDRLNALSDADPLIFTLWSDQQIIPGELWLDSINAQLDSCTTGLLLLSPNFLASTFIKDVELPTLLDENTGKNGGRIVPMLLRPIPNSLLASAGLSHHQYFAFNKKSYIEMNGNAAKDKFVNELYAHLVSDQHATA